MGSCQRIKNLTRGIARVLCDDKPRDLRAMLRARCHIMVRCSVCASGTLAASRSSSVSCQKPPSSSDIDLCDCDRNLGGLRLQMKRVKWVTDHHTKEARTLHATHAHGRCITSPCNHIHTCAHARTHAKTHMHACTRANTRTHTHTHTHTHTCTYTRTRIRTHAHKHTCT